MWASFIGSPVSRSSKASMCLLFAVANSSDLVKMPNCSKVSSPKRSCSSTYVGTFTHARRYGSLPAMRLPAKPASGVLPIRPSPARGSKHSRQQNGALRAFTGPRADDGLPIAYTAIPRRASCPAVVIRTERTAPGGPRSIRPSSASRASQ